MVGADAKQSDERLMRFFAACIYDMRMLLCHHLGGRVSSPELEAAGVAFALHEVALAVLEGRREDLDGARARLQRLDRRVGSSSLERIDHYLAACATPHPSDDPLEVSEVTPVGLG